MLGEALVTVEEFAKLPEDREKRLSLVAGWVVSEPWPVTRHGRIQARLLNLLSEYLRASPIGEVYVDIGFILSRAPDTVRAPDVSFVRTERVERQDDRRWYEGAPDLAIEVLSPSERSRQIHEKVSDYLAAGARAVWLVDPERRLVTVFRSPLTPQVLREGETVDGEDILPGLHLAVGDLFR